MHEDVDTWIKRFEHNAQIYKWSEQRKLNVLMSKLTGPVEQWLFSLPNQYKSSPSTLLGLLKNRYVSPTFDQSLQDQLRNRFHKPGESVTQYANDIQSLISRLCPSMPETDTIRTFASGLQPYLKVEVLDRRPSTFLEAVDIARRREHAIAAANVTPAQTMALYSPLPAQTMAMYSEPSNVDKQLNAMQESITALTQAIKEIKLSNQRPCDRRYNQKPECYHNSTEGRRSNNSSNHHNSSNRNPQRNPRPANNRIICNACGIPGHIAANCRKTMNRNNLIQEIIQEIQGKVQAPEQ